MLVEYCGSMSVSVVVVFWDFWFIGIDKGLCMCGCV